MSAEPTQPQPQPTAEELEARRLDKSDLSRAEIDSIRVVTGIKVEPMEPVRPKDPAS